MDIGAPVEIAAIGKQACPKALPDQVQALRGALDAQSSPITAKLLVRNFKGARADRVEELLATLAMLGEVRGVGDGRYAA